MEEPRTHYQLSFTARQALFLFVGLLAGLGVAFFLGLMTGLSGREPAGAAVAAVVPTPSPTPIAEALEVPRAVRGVAPPRGSSRGPATTFLPTAPANPPGAPAPAPAVSPSPGLQMFDDAPPAERTAPVTSPARSRPSDAPSASTPPASPAAFWVQALSASSEKEAHAKHDRLAAHGFPATVVPGPGPHGRVYRVRVGPFRTREEAQHAASRLKTKEKLEPWIVPPGK